MTGRASSSSSFSYQWTYDVFLNFRGEDIRHGFVGNLFNALRQKGIHTFMDDGELRKGDEITPSLLKAIEESRMAITVFSKNYASSTFCLDELVKILQCIKGNGRLVWPIFYDVDPSDVRHQKENYEEALVMHKKNFKANEEKVQNWKLALREVANLSGLHFNLGHEYEYQFIEKIVKEISKKINRTPLYVAKYPIGLESRVLKVKNLLEVGSRDEVIMVGIFGFGGMGKSTIARAVYNSIADQFEALCFLHDIKENSRKFGLEQMQERMLSKTLGVDIKVADVNEGVPIIKGRLNQKKVLLILDNVDRAEHLEKLSGNCDWFGFGSRIIITTRDQHLLVTHGVERLYEMNKFNNEESLQLLSWNAFKNNQVDPSYIEVLNSVVQYAKGLPLALEVIGSHLFGKSIEEWKSAIDIYRRIPNEEVQKILKVSYDDLEEAEKEIFLDIACFFIKANIEYVNDMVQNAHGFDPRYGIRVLMEKCLINYCYDRVDMHDLIRDMGREIVRQESTNEPGKRSRLWNHEDIVHVLENNTRLENLSAFNLSFCQFITHIPDISGIPNLRELLLHYCENLVEIHDSVGYLKKLETLEVSFCANLKNFPRDIKLRHLKYLGLMGCSSLEKFPEILEKMEYITTLDLSKTNLLLPFSIRNLIGLEELYMNNCRRIQVPSSIGMLPKVKRIFIERCEEVQLYKHDEGQDEVNSKSYLLSLSKSNLSDEFLQICLTGFANVATLNLSFSNFTILPACIKECYHLLHLYLEDCEHLKEIGGIPPNIETLWAQNCISLSSEFTSILLSQELHEAGNKQFCVPGSRIPEWLDHYSRGSSISFWFRNKFPAITVYYVMTLENKYVSTFASLAAKVIMNGKNIFYASNSWLPFRGDHIVVYDLRQTHLYYNEERDQVFLESEWNHVEIYLGVDGNVSKECGIHVIKQESSMEDILFTNPYQRRKLNDPLTTSDLIYHNHLLPEKQHGLVDMQPLDDDFNWDSSSLVSTSGIAMIKIFHLTQKKSILTRVSGSPCILIGKYQRMMGIALHLHWYRQGMIVTPLVVTKPSE